MSFYFLSLTYGVFFLFNLLFLIYITYIFFFIFLTLFSFYFSCTSFIVDGFQGLVLFSDPSIPTSLSDSSTLVNSNPSSHDSLTVQFTILTVEYDPTEHSYLNHIENYNNIGEFRESLIQSEHPLAHVSDQELINSIATPFVDSTDPLTVDILCRGDATINSFSYVSTSTINGVTSHLVDVGLSNGQDVFVEFKEE